MSFNPLAALVVHQLTPHLPADPTVVELGNQTFKAGDAALDRVIAAACGQAGPARADAEALAAIRALAPKARLGMTDAYYRGLGFAEYVCIDLTDDHGALIMDLNVDLAATYGYDRTFDLVTNNGTGEHVFNQLMVFANAHALTKVGGVMVHILPFVGWLNHGFYSFSPTLFGDLARENGYEVLRMAAADRNGGAVELPVPECFGPAVKQPAFVAAVERARSEHGPDLLIVAALRKTTAGAFRTPTQGVYDAAIARERRRL